MKIFDREGFFLALAAITAATLRTIVVDSAAKLTACVFT